MGFEIINVNELLKRLDKYNHKELHVHHTWRPNHANYNGSNGMSLQNGMRNYHVGKLGWSDIGQHITLLPDGKIVTGRNFSKTPASITGHNTNGFAMEMLGDFDIGKDKFEGEQKQVALKIAKYFLDKGKYVRFHRENASKTCPGTSIDKNIFISEAKGVLVNRGEPVVVTQIEKAKAYIGNRCKELQEKLNKVGYNLDVDGDFGQLTYNALIDFQSKNGLDVDGYAGVKSFGKLNELISLQNIIIESSYIKEFQKISSKLNYKDKNGNLLNIDGTYGKLSQSVANKYQLKKGSKNELVGLIQKILKEKGFYHGNIDNSFGNQTDKAVREFQKSKGLKVDGYVGSLTIGKLLN